MFLTIQRGILSPSCFWWKISDLFEDTSGINLYYQLGKNGKIKFVPFNAFGKPMYIVTDVKFIKEILDKSPHTFGVGKFKYDFFKTFMEYNVGVSEGCPWKRRRIFNEHVLDSDKSHRFNNIFDQHMKHLVAKGLPKNFDQFGQMGKMFAMKTVFGEDTIYEPIFEVISQSNSLKSIISELHLDPKLVEKYDTYIKYHIKNPKKHSLMELISSYPNLDKLSLEEIVHQVPHWIFPIAGLITVAAPRLLILLENHPIHYKKIIKEGYPYLRKCILELFRLNNPVNSTFRTLLDDYTFKNSNHTFKKGAQFLILNNCVLRDPKVFDKPNCFIPERWTPQLENSYHSIMFNQGPQRCPGKELAISILQSFITNWIKKGGMELKSGYKLDVDNIRQQINPCPIILA
jgi:cytochrome P450